MRGKGTEQHTRRPGKQYRVEDYDDKGNLKAPLWMWAGVVWLLQPWWLTAVGIVSHDTPSVAEVLYPTVTDILISLVAAIPAVLLCVVYPLRGRYPVAALMTYGTVYVGQVLELLRVGSVFLRMTGWLSEDTDLLLSFMCVDFAVLTGMLLTPRLWAVFGWPEVR